MKYEIDSVAIDKQCVLEKAMERNMGRKEQTIYFSGYMAAINDIFGPTGAKIIVKED